MMKISIFTTIVCFILFSNTVYSQKPSRITIKGILQDTTHEVIPFATVMLLNPADSSLANFTTSNDKGSFQFNNVKNSSYLLKVSHVSYLPLQKMITPSATDVNDMQIVEMKPISQTLMEVVIKAAKAPLRIRGDTVEYDATTFKVPPGSTVEDLLRRLPGIDVDAEGNISTQGKDVKRLYVDGKTFFGNDPKSVTKNIGAEAISKVQVYNEKSEQSQLTGIDDGSKEKAMNLQLKEEFKKGSFGKITVAAGTEDRLASRGNYNRFNEKIQLSFIGYANNINQTGVNWEDYGEFKGNNTFNDFDNGDFGFNNNSRGYYFSSNDLPGGYYDGKGLTKNYGAGTNYNYSGKKTKFNSSYFYNQTDLNYLQESYRQTFLEESKTISKYDTLNNNDFRSSHSIGTRFEHDFDSSNKFVVKANLRYSANDNKINQSQLFSDFSNNPYNSLNLNNFSDKSSLNITSAAIYRYKFKKKGRSFAISSGYNKNTGEGNNNQNSINTFFNQTTPTQQIKQLIRTNNNITELKASALYSEPLSKKWFVELFYNHSTLLNNNNNQAEAPMLNNSRIDSLSVYYEQITSYNRLGSSIRYSYNGLNGSIGVAAQLLNLTGRYALDENEPWNNDKVTKPFKNITPNLNVNYEFKNHLNLNAGYSNTISAPDFSDLQPLKNTSNPAYIVIGNADLVPEKTHGIDLSMHYWNPASFMSIGVSTNYGITIDPIVYNQNSSFVEGVGMVTTSMPENMSKGESLSGWFWSNIPIIKTKLTIDFNGGLQYSNNPTRINTIEDDIKSNSANFGSRINFTPGSKLVLSSGFYGNYTAMSYNINEQHNQDFYNYSVNASVKWQFANRMFLESNFNYSQYKNEKFDFNESIPLWNASVRRILGKKSKFEMRLAAFDIFNKNITLNQYASRNYIERSTTNTLARYFMLSLTYNMKGFESKIQKNRFW